MKTAHIQQFFPEANSPSCSPRHGLQFITLTESASSQFHVSSSMPVAGSFRLQIEWCMVDETKTNIHNPPEAHLLDLLLA